MADKRVRPHYQYRFGAAMAWPVRLGFVIGSIAAKSYDAIPGKTDAGS